MTANQGAPKPLSGGSDVCDECKLWGPSNHDTLHVKKSAPKAAPDEPQWPDGTRRFYPTGCPFCGDMNCPAFRKCKTQQRAFEDARSDYYRGQG